MELTNIAVNAYYFGMNLIILVNDAIWST